mmetsp:Transcript_89138/g.181813  ORF Transcript_89138/g.181813 Transcript_89138/m.181813 type:complete len:84 (+) Transcript_89138:1529-1780(+)
MQCYYRRTFNSLLVVVLLISAQIKCVASFIKNEGPSNIETKKSRLGWYSTGEEECALERFCFAWYFGAAAASEAELLFEHCEL